MAALRSITRLSTCPSRLGNPTTSPVVRRLATSTSALSEASHAQTLLQDKKHGLGFIRSNPRTAKPRKLGVTEIRGPYYSAYGKRHLQDLLETMGYHIDGFKFAGGSFALLPERALVEMIELAHEHGVYVSTASIIHSRAKIRSLNETCTGRVYRTYINPP